MKLLQFMASVTFVALLSTVLAAEETTTDPSLIQAENNLLRAENAKKDSQIKKLREDNTALAEQVKALKEACQKAGIIVPQPGPLTARSDSSIRNVLSAANNTAETIIYLGKPRSKEWFDRVYAMFADKIVCVGKDYIDIGKSVLTCPELGQDSKVGDYGGFNGKVLSIIKASEIIVRRPGYSTGAPAGTIVRVENLQRAMGYSVQELLFHVRGVQTKGMVDGIPYEANLVCVGTYKFDGTTVPSFVPRSSLSKEQFADALSKGFKLTNYKEVQDGKSKKIIATNIE
jgi:hypothetical protein